MTETSVPAHLQPLYDMIAGAFPNGIDDNLYLPLLAFLANGESHRNVADAIYIHTGRDWGVVYNDVLKAVSTAVRPEDLAAIELRLTPHGLARWRDTP